MGKRGGRRPGAGRKPGSVDKTTRQAKEILVEIADNNASRAAEELSRLEGKEFLDVYLKVLEYVVPKLSRSEVKNEGEQTLTIKHITDE